MLDEKRLPAKKRSHAIQGDDPGKNVISIDDDSDDDSTSSCSSSVFDMLDSGSSSEDSEFSILATQKLKKLPPPPRPKSSKSRKVSMSPSPTRRGDSLAKVTSNQKSKDTNETKQSTKQNKGKRNADTLSPSPEDAKRRRVSPRRNKETSRPPPPTEDPSLQSIPRKSLGNSTSQNVSKTTSAAVKQVLNYDHVTDQPKGLDASSAPNASLCERKEAAEPPTPSKKTSSQKTVPDQCETTSSAGGSTTSKKKKSSSQKPTGNKDSQVRQAKKPETSKASKPPPSTKVKDSQATVKKHENPPEAARVLATVSNNHSNDVSRSSTTYKKEIQKETHEKLKEASRSQANSASSKLAAPSTTEMTAANASMERGAGAPITGVSTASKLKRTIESTTRASKKSKSSNQCKDPKTSRSKKQSNNTTSTGPKTVKSTNEKESSTNTKPKKETKKKISAAQNATSNATTTQKEKPKKVMDKKTSPAQNAVTITKTPQKEIAAHSKEQKESRKPTVEAKKGSSTNASSVVEDPKTSKLAQGSTAKKTSASEVQNKKQSSENPAKASAAGNPGTNTSAVKKSAKSPKETPSKKADPPKKKKRSFQDQILVHMLVSCKPFTLKTLAQSVNSTENQLNYAMLSLLDKQLVIKKTFTSAKGRTKELYWANQESKAREVASLTTSPEEIEAARKELADLKRQEAAIAQQFAIVTQELGNEEINSRLQAEEQAVRALKQRLKETHDRIRAAKQTTVKKPLGSKVVKSAALLARERCPRRMKIRINAMRDEWKKRKDKCVDFIDQLADGMEKKPKDIVKLLELETDEMEGVKLPPKLALD